MSCCARSPVVRFFVKRWSCSIKEFWCQWTYSPLTSWGLELPGVSWRCEALHSRVMAWENITTWRPSFEILILHLPFWALSPRQCLSINKNHWHPKPASKCRTIPMVGWQLESFWASWATNEHSDPTSARHKRLDKLLSLRITSSRVNPQTNSNVQCFFLKQIRELGKMKLGDEISSLLAAVAIYHTGWVKLLWPLLFVSSPSQQRKTTQPNVDNLFLRRNL